MGGLTDYINARCQAKINLSERLSGAHMAGLRQPLRVFSRLEIVLQLPPAKNNFPAVAWI